MVEYTKKKPFMVWEADTVTWKENSLRVRLVLRIVNYICPELITLKIK
jgi:hypothetical protein